MMMDGGPAVWRRLFAATNMSSAVTIFNRLSGTGEYSACTWIKSDDALHNAAGINREKSHYVVLDAQSLLGLSKGDVRGL